jgi:hypothetical protein
MQQVDVQVAAIALTLGCVLVTKDSDFQAISGLTIEDWSQEHGERLEEGRRKDTPTSLHYAIGKRLAFCREPTWQSL